MVCNEGKPRHVDTCCLLLQSRPPSRQRPPEEAIFLGDVDVRRANESDEDSEESIRESVLVSSDGK